MSEYAELVERLDARRVADPAPYYKPDSDCQDAKAAILTLEAQVKEMREALERRPKPLAEGVYQVRITFNGDGTESYGPMVYLGMRASVEAQEIGDERR